MTAAATAPVARQGGVFSTRVAVGLILTAVAAAAAFAVLSAFAPQLRSGNDGQSHALSKSAIGFAGMVGLLRDTGHTVLITRRPPQSPRDVGLLVLTPSAGVPVDRITLARHGARTLIVLPKWRVGGNALHPGWVNKVGLVEPAEVLSGAIQSYSPTSTLARSKTAVVAHLRTVDGVDLPTPGPVTSLQLLSGKAWRPVVVDQASGLPVLVQLSGNDVFVLSDPDLLNTQGIRDLATARTGVALIDLVRRTDGPLLFDVTLYGYERSNSLLRLALEPPLLGATLCLVAAALLAGLHAGVRFGPAQTVRRGLAFGKQALADNTAALIHLARREHSLGVRYAEFARREVARAVGAPPTLDDDALDAFLDRLSLQAGKPEFSRLRDAARRATSVAAMLEAARAIHDWRLEMTRERR